MCNFMLTSDCDTFTNLDTRVGEVPNSCEQNQWTASRTRSSAKHLIQLRI